LIAENGFVHIYIRCVQSYFGIIADLYRKNYERMTYEFQIMTSWRFSLSSWK